MERPTARAMVPGELERMDMYAVMRNDVRQLGTGMELLKGERVILERATNLPDANRWVKYYARPASGKWCDGLERGPDDSILLDSTDINYDPNDVDDMAQRNRMIGHHWFSRETMRFFKTRVNGPLLPGPRGVFFVTSEVDPSGRKAYSVRMFNCTTNQVDTVGEFHSYGSRGAAFTAARRAALMPLDPAPVYVLS